MHRNFITVNPMRAVSSILLLILAAILIGCGSSDYSETTPEKAKAAREKIKEAEGKIPGAVR